MAYTSTDNAGSKNSTIMTHSLMGRLHEGKKLEPSAGKGASCCCRQESHMLHNRDKGTHPGVSLQYRIGVTPPYTSPSSHIQLRICITKSKPRLQPWHSDKHGVCYHNQKLPHTHTPAAALVQKSSTKAHMHTHKHTGGSKSVSSTPFQSGLTCTTQHCVLAWPGYS